MRKTYSWSSIKLLRISSVTSSTTADAWFLWCIYHWHHFYDQLKKFHWTKKLVSPVDPVIYVSSVRKITSKKRRDLKDYFWKQKQRYSMVISVIWELFCTWKLKKRRAGSFLRPYWPASSLSSILTKEMSSSAQSSAIVSRFFTIWSWNWKTCLRETSSHLLVPLGAEEKNSNVVKLANKPSKDNIGHL